MKAPVQHGDDVFERIYHSNAWSGHGSRSGAGSDLQQTEVLRTTIPDLLRSYGIQRLLDAPCGDFHWLSATELPVREYVGVDIVADIVETLRARYGSPVRRFMIGNIVNDVLPETDLILCRDGLVHLSNRDIWMALANFRRTGAMYLLCTTFPARLFNARDVRSGGWRTLNLERQPFKFPRPIEVLNEGLGRWDRKFGDKSLSLWRLEDIPEGPRG